MYLNYKGNFPPPAYRIHKPLGYIFIHLFICRVVCCSAMWLYCYFVLQALSTLFHYLIQPVTLVFCGHRLDTREFAAVNMAISVRV